MNQKILLTNTLKPGLWTPVVDLSIPIALSADRLLVASPTGKASSSTRAKSLITTVDG